MDLTDTEIAAVRRLWKRLFPLAIRRQVVQQFNEQEVSASPSGAEIEYLGNRCCPLGVALLLSGARPGRQGVSKPVFADASDLPVDLGPEADAALDEEFKREYPDQATTLFINHYSRLFDETTRHLDLTSLIPIEEE